MPIYFEDNIVNSMTFAFLTLMEVWKTNYILGRWEFPRLYVNGVIDLRSLQVQQDIVM